MSQPTPTCSVTATTSLTQDEFFQQATALAWATSQASGLKLMASSGINHTPAYWCEHAPGFGIEGGFAMSARTDYYVQVRDLKSASVFEVFGAHRFTARGTTAEDCLAELVTKLRDLEERAYEAAPTRAGEQHCELAKDDGLYDYAA